LYGYYMDKALIERYGLGFKEKLYKEADSLYLSKVNSRRKYVMYWDCDERPRLPREKKRTSDELPTIKTSEISIGQNSAMFDIFFISHLIALSRSFQFKTS
jgi:hypothetical protein